MYVTYNTKLRKKLTKLNPVKIGAVLMADSLKDEAIELKRNRSVNLRFGYLYEPPKIKNTGFHFVKSEEALVKIEVA